MAMQPILQRYETWRSSVLEACEEHLVRARGQFAAVQHDADADERIEKIEQLLRAKLEPILLERQEEHELIVQAAARLFEQMESPTQADETARERIGAGPDALRDWLDRKMNSMVAQARAQELAPPPPASVPAPPYRPGATPPATPAAKLRSSPLPPPRFCTSCGAALGPPDMEARKCVRCNKPIGS